MKRSTTSISIENPKKFKTPDMPRFNTGNEKIDSPGTSNQQGHNRNGQSEDSCDQSQLIFFGKSVIEKTYFFTGTVEKIIKWHRLLKDHHCMYEVIASIVSLQEGAINLQKLLLLKDKKGPILQVVHYVTHNIHLQDFTVGQILRCVGYMSGPNSLTAISIRVATSEELATLKRYCYICEFAIAGLVNV